MKRVALWTAITVLPLLMGAASFGLYHANQTATTVSFVDCCLDPNCPPGCCDQCPPDCLLTLTAKTCCPEGDCCPEDGCCSGKTQKAAAYMCPVTGEELPCPDCCPFNQK